MDEKPEKQSDMALDEQEKAARKIRVLGIAYRVLLVLGLVLFAVTLVLVILSTRITAWFLTIPLVIFLLGIILARLEYRLFLRS